MPQHESQTHCLISVQTKTCA